MRTLLKFSLILSLIFVFTVGCSDMKQSDPVSSNNQEQSSLNKKPGSRAIVQDVSGTINGLPFEADLLITRFVQQNGTVYAVGTLTNITGTGLPANVTDLVGQVLRLPVLFGNHTCEILFLQLGPLDLDLLGLVIHLDQVTLEITAEQGEGNLLGNLLCAIAGLLDGNGPLGDILANLNRIIGIIGIAL